MLRSISLPADIHAVLLSDVILLLQEKDQKLVFAAVVSSPQCAIFVKTVVFLTGQKQGQVTASIYSRILHDLM